MTVLQILCCCELIFICQISLNYRKKKGKWRRMNETENRNEKLKRKTETEIGNGKAEIWKWSSENLNNYSTILAYYGSEHALR